MLDQLDAAVEGDGFQMFVNKKNKKSKRHSPDIVSVKALLKYRKKKNEGGVLEY